MNDFSVPLDMSSANNDHLFLQRLLACIELNIVTRAITGVLLAPILSNDFGKFGDSSYF